MHAPSGASLHSPRFGNCAAQRLHSLQCPPLVPTCQRAGGAGVSPTKPAEYITMDRASSAGFTLIELLISIAIIAILSAVAFPSYTDHVRRGHAAVAAAALASWRVGLEQYYQDHRRYGANGACGGATPSSREFSYRCETPADGQGFLATAIGDGTRGMGDFIYSIDHAGQRRTLGLPAGWGATPRDCWVGSRSGAC